LPRHSIDLDFDAHKRTEIEPYLHAGISDAGVKALRSGKTKETDTSCRYKLHYWNPYEDMDILLKIEISYRIKPDPCEIEIVNGIRTYKFRRSTIKNSKQQKTELHREIFLILRI